MHRMEQQRVSEQEWSVLLGLLGSLDLSPAPLFTGIAAIAAGSLFRLRQRR